MSFAIYAESDTYVHLVGGETAAETFDLFIKDLNECGVKIKDVFNVYAVNGKDEAIELENVINEMIRDAQ